MSLPFAKRPDTSQALRTLPRPGAAQREASARRIRAAAALLAACLAGCASGPPAPDWQANTKSAMDAAVAAYLAGNSRAEAQELARARSEVGRTGRADLAARVELMRCAAHVASLEFQPCAGFEPLRADSGPAERVYADYLAGRLPTGAEREQLPPAQRAVAAGGASLATVQAIEDPLSRLIAIAVQFQVGQARPELMALAVDTASAQGWRRPLLAWLKVQQQRATRAGDATAAAQLQRRIDLVEASTRP
ncbi:hypothetical protein [Ideonella sp. BN130291]|uniref:hypothetical protein n=1 Tax=Ideonella sp. BN130291 TaxID=3112940 RepID=UPI002E26F26A|nr:hypothetical protein [Ideonella sp. BN130291]